MAGFTFRFRESGGAPTILDLISADAALAKGDLVNLESGKVDLAATDDAALVGVVLETKSGMNTTSDRIKVIVDKDAVYGVVDANARAIGATLDLSGGTGAQTVTSTGNADFRVARDSSATEETLVSFTVDNHWTD